jgi:hypothetical protein
MELADLEIPPFCFTMHYKGRQYHLSVKQTRLDISIEQFEVSGERSAKLLQSLRPYYRLHDGRTLNYGLGPAPGTVVKDKEALEIVIEEIRKVIAWFENSAAH